MTVEESGHVVHPDRVKSVVLTVTFDKGCEEVVEEFGGGHRRARSPVVVFAASVMVLLAVDYVDDDRGEVGYEPVVVGVVEVEG